MIVDSHAHIFPPMRGESGHKTPEDHMKYVQSLLMFHHQPVRRVDDNSIYTGPNLLFDGKDYSIEGLKNVNYHAAGQGKFVWTSSGVDYSLQYLPPNLMRMHSPPELIVAHMDYVGVQKAVLQTGHAYGHLNDYMAEAIREFPDRFWALAMIDEWRADRQSQAQALDNAITELGLHGLWFQSSNLQLHKRGEPIDDPAFHPFWDHVREMGIPVFWFVSSVTPGKEPYMEQLRAFGRWLERYPDIPVLYTHGLPLFRFLDHGEISIPDEAWSILDAPNVTVEILIPIFQGAIWEYPFVEAQPIIEKY
ncbi:MAG: amidohydrolase, partial [Chloroflexi bacterium]|nr:amidohydrolase [Chloroflexota bacterium]